MKRIFLVSLPVILGLSIISCSPTSKKVDKPPVWNSQQQEVEQHNMAIKNQGEELAKIPLQINALGERVGVVEDKLKKKPPIKNVKGFQVIVDNNPAVALGKINISDSEDISIGSAILLNGKMIDLKQTGGSLNIISSSKEVKGQLLDIWVPVEVKTTGKNVNQDNEVSTSSGESLYKKEYIQKGRSKGKYKLVKVEPEINQSPVTNSSTDGEPTIIMKKVAAEGLLIISTDKDANLGGFIIFQDNKLVDDSKVYKYLNISSTP